MDPLVATLFLVLLALLGARVSFPAAQVPVGPRLMFRTGTHFLFVGFLLGPPVLGLVSREAIGELSPLIGLGLGWVGMLFGLQLDRSMLSQFSRAFHIIAFGQAALTFFVVLAAVFGGAAALGIADRELALLLTIAAAIASVSTPAGIAIVAARGDVRRLLFFIAALDGVVAILALDVAYAWFHDVIRPGTDAAPGWFWGLSSIGLGIVCAITFLWLGRLRPNREELVLYLLGISALSAGAALQLQLSPLFVGMVLGAVVVNLSPDGDRIFRAMGAWEKPIYVILLLLAGALLRFPTWWIVPLALVFALLRAAAKVFANAVMVSATRRPRDTPRGIGMGLISQGGISLAMVLSAVLTLGPLGIEVFGFAAVDLLFSTVVIGVVLSELVGPVLVAKVLTSAGELGSRPAQRSSPATGSVP